LFGAAAYLLGAIQPGPQKFCFACVVARMAQ
jgi:hypothetical protein